MRSIPGGSMVLDRPGSADPKAAVKVGTDLDEFRQALRGGAAEDLRHALSLVRGPFLAGIDGERFPWLQEVRRKIEQDCTTAAGQLAGPGDAATAAVAEFFAAPDGTLLDALEPLLAPGAASESPETDPLERDASRSMRNRYAAALVAVGVIAIVLMVAFDRGEDEGSELGPNGRAEAVAGEMSTSPEVGLAAGLRVANRTLGDRWGTHVEPTPRTGSRSR